MATVREMMMQDAPASIETSYMMAVGDTFDRRILPHANDNDWIAIELSEGYEYTITVGGSECSRRHSMTPF